MGSRFAACNRDTAPCRMCLYQDQIRQAPLQVHLALADFSYWSFKLLLRYSCRKMINLQASFKGSWCRDGNTKTSREAQLVTATLELIHATGP